jgi:enterochelin esterase-like enzyme
MPFFLPTETRMSPELHPRPLARPLLAATVLCLALAGCAHAPATPVQAAPPATVAAAARIETLELAAPGVADAPLRVRVFLPPGYDASAAIGYPVLYLNDGQDAEAVGLARTLEALVTGGGIRPVIVAAIDMPPDRMGAYGLSDRRAGTSVVASTKYGPVGSRAHAYSQWVVGTLVPAIDARYRTRTTPDARAVLGWSLGAVNAWDLGWQYPDVFARIGAFSPSLWLAARREDATQAQATRLVQGVVDQGELRGGLKQYFAVGTREETDDRDGDGVNDALDDARDLVEGWHEAGQ